MAEFEGMAKALQIPQSVLNNITKIDEKINRIASDSEKMATHFMSAMTRMGSGADTLLRRLQAIQDVINGLGSVKISGLGNVNKDMGSTATNAEKAASNISAAANAMNKFNTATNTNNSVVAWQELQKKIEQVEQRQQQLVKSLREYEYSVERFKQGKGIILPFDSNAVKAEIEANKQAIASYREKQQAIIATVQQQRQAAQMAQALRNYEQERTSLPNQRSAEELRRLNEYYRELERASAAAATAAEKAAQRQQRTQERAAQAAERAARRQEEANARTAQRQQNIREAREYRENANALNAYNRAMSASEALVTQRINKIARLRQAEEMLRATGRDYTVQLQRIQQEIQRLNKLNQGQLDQYGRIAQAQRNVGNIGAQLTRQLALIFSVSAIEGYIMKLVQVRGEFELQNTALASILQNKDQADQLFAQITELAVRSPFTIKELNSYTKQLAAYQVQYEDLFSTTKMLADVSAGLGVDMSRLILAFGQVKAANILRGTEVRQFTEAGLNILGELAKYYSELEGRMISVGEVQERVTRRMVSFGDVEEVFRRVTSAGGLFYDMQEKQADTLLGQYRNLQDQIDLMLNDIGKSNQGVILSVISLLKTIIENWEGIYNVMSPIVGVLTTYILLTNRWVGAIPNLKKAWGYVNNALTNVRLSLTAAGRAQSAFNKQTALNGWLLIGAAVIAVIWEVVNAINAARERQEEYNKTVREGWTNAEEAVTRFKVLAKAVTDVTTTYDEQKSALDELRRSYSDILPEQQLTADGIRAMAGDYEAATKAIREYYKVQTEQKLVQQVNQNYAEDITEATDDLATSISDKLTINARAMFHDLSLVTAESIQPAVEEFRRQLEEGLIDTTDDEKIYSAFAELLKSRVPSEMEGIVDNLLDGKTQFSIINDLVDVINDKLKEQNRVLARNAEFTSLEGEQLNKQRDILDANIKQMKSLMNTIANYGNDPLVTEQQVTDAKSKLAELLKQYGISAEEIANLTNDAWQIRQATIDFNKRMLQSFIDWVNNQFSTQDSFIGRFIQGLIGEKNALENSPTQQYIQNLFQSAAAVNDIDMGNFIDKLMSANETVDDYIKRLKSSLDSAKADIERYKINPNLVPHIGSEQQFEELKKEAAVIEAVLATMSPQKDTKGTSKNPELDKLKEQVAMIEKAAKAYEDYRKLYDEETAQRMVETAFEKPFDNLDLNFDMTFDAQGIIAAYRQLAQSVGGDAQEYIEGKIAEGLTDVTTEQRTKEVEEYRKQIDELFASLSNYQELEKLGLNKDLISQLFGIDIASIDDVKAAFDKMKDNIKEYGISGEDLIAWAENKITDAQQKELENRLKKFADYISEYSDDTKRIMYESGENIGFANLLFNEGKINSDEYVEIIRNIVRDTNDELSKINLDKFQRSSEYIQAMGDLSLYSKRQLQDLSNKLKDVIAQSSKTMSPKDIDEYYDALGRINSQMKKISENTPWENTPISKITRLIKAQQDFSNAQQAYKKHEDDKNTYENKLKLLQQQLEVYKAQQQTAKSGSAEAMVLQKNIADTQGQIGNIMQLVSGAESGMASASTTMSAISSSLGGAVGGAAGAIAVVDAIVKGVYQSINATIEMFYEIKDLAESFGANVDEGAWENMSIAASYISEMNEQVMGSWESFKSGDMIGASVKAFQAVSSVIQGFNAIHDNKREQKIRKELELLDDLEYAYEKLEKAIEDAYTFDTYQKAFDQSKENLEQQKAALEEAIRLEEDKKKTDEDRIKEWEQQIDDIDEQLEELAEEQFSTATAGILDDITSASEEFVDAWLEAFRETGDGMQGLEENFQTMLENMLKRQAAMTIVAPFLEKWEKELEKYINENDMKLTTDEAKKWVDSVTETIPGLSSALEAFFEAMKEAGFNLEQADDGDTLSGLQKGIQNITEETAQALEALLSSIRFFVSQQNVDLANIRNLLTAPPTDNPFYQELQSQTEYLRLTYSLFTSLSTNGQGGGKVLKVKIY